MKILVIGGTNFIGPPVVRQLSAMGHDVTLFHRGKTIAELPADVHQILGDRTHLGEFKSKFEQLSPQVVLDMIPYTEEDALTVMNTFRGIAQRVVAISSMDVYRAYDVLWGGYSETVPPDEALRRTIDWQRTHPPKEQEQSLQPWLLDYATEDAILTKLI